MRLIQGALYKVHGCSLHVYVKKIRHVSETYTKCIIEFVSKDKQWRVFQTIKNCTLKHDQISHWEKVKQ